MHGGSRASLGLYSRLKNSAQMDCSSCKEKGKEEDHLGKLLGAAHDYKLRNKNMY